MPLGWNRYQIHAQGFQSYILYWSIVWAANGRWIPFWNKPGVANLLQQLKSLLQSDSDWNPILQSLFPCFFLATVVQQRQARYCWYRQIDAQDSASKNKLRCSTVHTYQQHTVGSRNTEHLLNLAVPQCISIFLDVLTLLNTSMHNHLKHIKLRNPLDIIVIEL